MSTPMLLTQSAPNKLRNSDSIIQLRTFSKPSQTFAQQNTNKPCKPMLSSVGLCHPPPAQLSVKALASKMPNKEMGVVKGLDLKRYMGRWYEIASFPFRFQPCDGVNSRATYTVRNDGTVHVLNEVWSGGKRGYIEGTAYKVDPNSADVKFEFKFYVPPFLPIIPVVGDYWVLHVDDDYQYALIGQPSRKYLWIISREPHLDDEIYKELVEKAKDEGYDVSKLQKIPQSDPPSAEDGPQDTKGIWWIKSLLLGKNTWIINN